jgi:UDP-N-acetylmuramoyl-tripeptide--D-alanyl-D-alanine ligase
MIKLNLQETAKALKQSAPDQNITFEGISIDTRTVQAGNLFIAIKGPAYDAHNFVKEAQDSGAVALIVEREVDCSLPQIIVPNTTLALGDLAHYWRSKFNIPVVGITGSVGKTTTKQMVAAILSQCGKTLYSEGNKNNYYGVPLTLFQLNSDYEYAVIEMGADRAGEIKYLANVAKPTVGIITMVAPVHIEGEGSGFGSIEGVFQEKTELFKALGEEGIAILNADDNFYGRWKELIPSQCHPSPKSPEEESGEPGDAAQSLIKNSWIPAFPLRGLRAGMTTVSFGFNPVADISAQNLQAKDNLQYSFDLKTPQGSIHINLSVMGKHNIPNALAATAAALALNIPLEKIKQGLKNIPLADKRMNTYRSPEGALIVDDSYNANVCSVPAVMETLAGFTGKRIMVFGDMLEIGSTSLEEHFKIGQKAKELKLDYFFAFGLDSVESVKAFGEGAQHFSDQQELIKVLRPLLDENTTVAVKGSRGMKLENIVEALKNATMAI